VSMDVIDGCSKYSSLSQGLKVTILFAQLFQLFRGWEPYVKRETPVAHYSTTPRAACRSWKSR
jgi:hypothetical protein